MKDKKEIFSFIEAIYLRNKAGKHQYLTQTFGEGIYTLLQRLDMPMDDINWWSYADRSCRWHYTPIVEQVRLLDDRGLI